MSNELDGVRVASFESRRAEEMARLVEKRGGEALRAPSMREVPLETHEDVLEAGDRLLAGRFDVIVLLTGVGTRMLVDVLATKHAREAIVTALGALDRVCRGPKPAAALREMGLRPTAVAPEPNTWREVLGIVDERIHVAGRRVAVQEYGARNDALMDGLAERGAEVEPVTIYRWGLPEDTGPLERTLAALAAGDVDVASFTSATQVGHVLEVARRIGLSDAVCRALAGPVTVASVGPTTSEALRKEGIEPDVEPEHPKMGHLAAAIARAKGSPARENGSRTRRS